MVYCDKFIAVVRVNGEILREDKNVVHLPFGSEYSILMKNLSTRRVNVDINIDGKDVLNGSSIVIDSESQSEITGFLEGNSVMNNFKFIQKTKEIAEYRGDKIDDGIIVIKYAFEKERNDSFIIYENTYFPTHPYKRDDGFRHPYRTSDIWYGSSFVDNNVRGISNYKSEINSQNYTCDACDVNIVSGENVSSNSLNLIPEPNKDEGITVKGSESNQKFQTTTVGYLERSKTIVIQMKGKQEDKLVSAPLLVKTKLTCETCGKKSKSNIKFCPNCGTYLL